MVNQMDENDPRFVYLPLDQADKATGSCNVYKDYWCLVHPEKGILFWQTSKRYKGSVTGASIQGNRDRTITDYLAPRYPWAEVKQIPLIIIPMDPYA